jgi:hypothetical protein
VSFVLALAFVHQGVQLRKGQREIEQLREREQQAHRTRWHLADAYRRLEVQRHKLARERQEHEQILQKAALLKSESMQGNNLLTRLFAELRSRKPLPQEPRPKQKDKH